MQKTPPGPADYALLATLSLLWGGAFPLSKIAVADYPPITLTLCRQLVATITLALLVAALRRAWFRPSARDIFNIAVCALLGSVLPFTLINWSVEKVDSGMAAILMGFMPLVTLVMAHFFTDDEKMTLPKLCGIALGITGLAILFWPSLSAGLGENFARQLALLGAAACYSGNALFLKRLVGHPPLVLMSYIGAFTVLFLLPLSLALDAPLTITPSATSTVAMIALGILSYAVGALFMFAIVARQGVVFFGQINLLVPVAGVLLAVVFLGERPGPSALAALAIIFGGLVAARIKPSGKSSIPQESHP